MPYTMELHTDALKIDRVVTLECVGSTNMAFRDTKIYVHTSNGEKIAECKYQFGEIDLFCENFKCSVVIK